MDIKKLIQEIILEAEGDAPQLTRGQRDQLAALTRIWREQVPEITDEQALVIYLKIKEIIPKIDPSGKQVAVGNFLRRHDGRFGPKYTVDDLKGITKVDFPSLMEFLYEMSNFKNPITKGDGEKAKTKEEIENEIFDFNGLKITPEKIETSKTLWESNENKVVDEGGLRIYEIKTQEQARRLGYYYQELLLQKVKYNRENGVGHRSVMPWCVQARSQDQMVKDEKGDILISSVGNMYSSYRSSNHFYFVIDENRDLFQDVIDPITGRNGVSYYISTIMVNPLGRFQICNMYNSPMEQPATWEQIVGIYPELASHRDVFQYMQYDPQRELSQKTTTILDLINEDENSQYDFSRQTSDVKESYITAGRPLSKPRSWAALTNNQRQEYINGFDTHNIAQRCNNYDFYKAIVQSSSEWKKKLDTRLKQVGHAGIILLVANFMKNDYTKSTIGFKNPDIVLFQNIRTKRYGIFNVKECDFITKDGIYYGSDYAKGQRIDIDDDENSGYYWAIEYTNDSGNKFYTLHDDDFIGDDRKKAYIMSEKKWNEISEKFLEDTTTYDLPKETDIGEIKKGV